jgi:two-component system cell cycle response regulator DivK
MTQKLLLVADDQEDNRIILSAILTHYGYGILQASNGHEAVEQAIQHLPDLILMDIEMPGMDGWEATRLIKADPAARAIPVVAVTAQNQRARATLLEAGFCAFVRKPVLPRDVVRAVELCLQANPAQAGWIDLPTFEPRPV